MKRKRNPWNLVASEDGSTLEISLYGDIEAGWWCDGTDKIVAAQLAAYPNAAAINVKINSSGGDMFAGIAIYNMLQARAAAGVVVVCTVEGQAASAASLVAMAGRTVMGRGAMLMVHNPWTIAMGEAKDFRAAADMLDKAQESLISIYAAKTSKTPEELKALLDGTTWLTADDAKAQGFADEVLGSAADPVVEARGERVIFNGIPFPKAAVAPQIFAMAKPGPRAEGPCNCSSCGTDCPCVPDHCDEECVCACDKGVVDPTEQAAAAAAAEAAFEMKVQARVAAAIMAAPPPVLNRAELVARAPELLAALVAEGHAAGVAAERKRLEELDGLPAAGVEDLVRAAKYGEQPSDRATLAVAILTAGNGAAAELLAKRRLESLKSKGITPAAIESDPERVVIATIVKAANHGRGA